MKTLNKIDILVLFLLLTGCAHYLENDRKLIYEDDYGYR